MIWPLSIAILLISLIMLIILMRIDLRDRLLPNIYVFPFGVLGLLFHSLHSFSYCPPESMALGALGGAGLLLGVRFFANAYYKRDTLGLGDVKLMGAAGLWLGLEHIFLAISLGAFFGVLHGLGYAVYKKSPSLAQLSIPAGPAFIAAIIQIFLIKILWT